MKALTKSERLKRLRAVRQGLDGVLVRKNGYVRRHLSVPWETDEAEATLTEMLAELQ